MGTPTNKLKSIGVKSPSSNLTGVARKVRDKSADFVNNIYKLKKVQDEGFEIVTKISNFMISNDKIPSFNEKCFSKLEKLADDLNEIIRDYEVLVTKQINVCEVVSMVEKMKPEEPFPLVGLKQLYEMMLEITEMYQEDLKIKKSIISLLIHNDNITYNHVNRNNKYIINNNKSQIKNELKLKLNKTLTSNQMLSATSLWIHQPPLHLPSLHYYLYIINTSTGLENC